MPLDPRIIQAAGPGYVAPLDPVAVLGRGLGLAQAYRQHHVGQMEFADAQRQEQERGRLAQAFRSALTTDPTTGQATVDVPRVFSEAYRTTTDPWTIFTAQQEYQTGQAKSRKEQLEAAKVQLERQQTGLEYGGQIAQGVEEAIQSGGDPQQAWDWGIRQMAQAGFPIEGVPPTPDKSFLARWKGAALKQKDAIAAQQKAIDQQLEEHRIALQRQQEERLRRGEGREERRLGFEERRLGVEEARESREAGKPRMTPGQAVTDALLELYGQPPAGQDYTPEQYRQARQRALAGAERVAAAQGAEAARLARTEKPLEGEAAKAVAELSSLQAMTDDVTDLFDPSYTGQFEGRWGAVRQWAGKAPQREVVFRRVVADLKDQLLRARSGAAITQSEYERLRTLVPQASDADQTFQAKLLGFRRALDQTKAARLEAATTGRGELRARQPGVTPLPGEAAGALPPRPGAAPAPPAGQPGAGATSRAPVTTDEIGVIMERAKAQGQPVSAQEVIRRLQSQGYRIEGLD